VKSRYKDSHVEVKSNADSVLAELRGFAVDLASIQAFRGEIWTEVEYAIFVEFGTYKMLPRAMIRKSIPAIEAYFEEQWQALPAMFTRGQFEAMVERVMLFALAKISGNTPVKSGDLRRSWNASVRFGRVTKMLGL